MNKIKILEKKSGNLLFIIEFYNKKLFYTTLKKFKKNKLFNVIVEQ